MTQPIPNFANEEEEQVFWDSHDSTEYLDWDTAKRVIFQLAQNKKQAVFAFLENEVWPQVPADVLGKPLAKDEVEQILGCGELSLRQ